MASVPRRRQRRSLLQPTREFVVRCGWSTVREFERPTVAQIATPSGERGTTRRLVQPSHFVLCPLSPLRIVQGNEDGEAVDQSGTRSCARVTRRTRVPAPDLGIGAPDRTRTCDLPLRRGPRYPLCHRGKAYKSISYMLSSKSERNPSADFPETPEHDVSSRVGAAIRAIEWSGIVAINCWRTPMSLSAKLRRGASQVGRCPEDVGHCLIPWC